MECRDVRELAESYLCEELLVETNHQVLRHLDACPACRADLAARQELRTGLRRAFTTDPALQPREGFRRELLDRLQRATAPAFVRPRLAAKWTATAMAVAAALVVFLSGGDLAGMARDAAGDHRDCAVHFNLLEEPISLDTAADQYGDLFRRLDEVPPPQLATAGGAIRVVNRHSCVFGGRRFAHVVLDYQGHVISLLVTKGRRSWLINGRPAGAPDLAWPAPIDGFTIASLSAAVHTVFIVSDLDRSRLEPVAETLLASVLPSLEGA